jgi:copper transport protein
MRRLSVAALLSVAAIFSVYSIASAHLALVSSHPAGGSRLDAAPPQIRLQFNEAVDPKLATISIVLADSTRVTLALTRDSSNTRVLLAGAPPVGAGTFRVVWRVVSADGHPVSGSFSFVVAPGAITPPDAPDSVDRGEPQTPRLSSPPPIPAILRGLGVGALAALAGLLGFALRAPSTAAQSRAIKWLAVAAPVFTVAHLVAWLLHTAPDDRLTGQWISSVFGSPAGRVELWRSMCALLALGTLWLTRRPQLAVVLALPALLLSSAIGHSATFQPLRSIPLKAAHLLALSVWLGGLLWLTTRDRVDLPSFARATSRVSSAALIGVIVIAVSGIAQALVILPSISSIRSTYGGVLVAKIAGLLILVGFGAYHRYRLMPRLANATSDGAANAMATSLRREIAVVCCVVVLGGLLAYTPPPESDSGRVPAESRQ